MHYKNVYSVCVDRFLKDKWHPTHVILLCKCYLFVCLFVCLFEILRPSKIFHTYGDVTIAGEWLFILTYATKQWRFFTVPLLLCHVASVLNGHLREPVILTCCCAIDSGAMTTCYYDLGLLRLGFEHLTFHMQGERSNRLRQCVGM